MGYGQCQLYGSSLFTVRKKPECHEGNLTGRKDTHTNTNATALIIAWLPIEKMPRMMAYSLINKQFHSLGRKENMADVIVSSDLRIFERIERTLHKMCIWS